MPTRMIGTILFAVVCLGWIRASAAQEAVQWRRDYQAARREALATGRPLFLDFGTEDCFWCKKLDVTTFRDPGVARLLNSRFVPTKVGAEREPQLVSALNVQTYPTLVLASAAGKVLAIHEGYADAGRCAELAQQALSGTGGSAAANRPVAEPGITVRGQKQDEEAVRPPPAVVRTTAVPFVPEECISEREQVARELLQRAREDFRAHEYKRCLERCRLLSAGYPDLPEVEQARTLTRSITEQAGRKPD